MSTDYAQPHASGVTTEGLTGPDKLFDRETITRKVTIAAGAAHVRGELLGKITANSKYILSLSAAADGSQVPDAVLLHDVDATGADQEAIVAIKGRFAIQGMTFGAGQTAAGVDATLRDKNIYLENIVG